MSELSLENERFIDEIVTSGRFESRSGALDEAVRLLCNEIRENGRNGADVLTAAEWCERFETWAAGHRQLPQEADDSRESIYSGRGE